MHVRIVLSISWIIPLAARYPLKSEATLWVIKTNNLWICMKKLIKPITYTFGIKNTKAFIVYSKDILIF